MFKLLDVNRQWKTYMKNKTPRGADRSVRNKMTSSKHLDISNSDLVKSSFLYCSIETKYEE